MTTAWLLPGKRPNRMRLPTSWPDEPLLDAAPLGQIVYSQCLNPGRPAIQSMKRPHEDRQPYCCDVLPGERGLTRNC